LVSLSNYINNAKKTIDNLTNNVNTLKNLINDPKKLTLFNNSNASYSCPLSAQVYRHTVSVDICKFVSPYRPILVLFFTLIFSLEVFIQFLKIFLKGGE